MHPLLHLDDMLLSNSSKTEIIRLKNLLKSKFDIKDLGNAKKILRMITKRNMEENLLTVSRSI